VPVSGTVIGPAELVTTNWSVAAAAAVGAKVTLAETNCPGARVEPTAGTPVTVNGAPGSVTPLIVRGEPPELEIASGLV